MFLVLLFENYEVIGALDILPRAPRILSAALAVSIDT